MAEEETTLEEKGRDEEVVTDEQPATDEQAAVDEPVASDEPDTVQEAPAAEPALPEESDAAAESAPAKPSPVRPVLGEPLETVIEALLFVSAEPVKVARLAETTGSTEPEVRAALKKLSADYEERERAFEIVEIARGFQLMTRPAFHDAIEDFRTARAVHRLSPSAMETLAIVAYKQPLIRADIEAIRGVQCGPVLRNLLDRKLIKVAGRDKRPGSPILYRTTRRFMEHFGLKSLKGLPSVEELRAPGA